MQVPEIIVALWLSQSHGPIRAVALHLEYRTGGLSSSTLSRTRTSEKPKKAKVRELQNGHAHLPFVVGEEVIGGGTIVEMRQEREAYVRQPYRETPWS